MVDQVRSVVACTGCGKQYAVSSSSIGHWARCKSCGTRFRLDPDSSPPLRKGAEPQETSPRITVAQVVQAHSVPLKPTEPTEDIADAIRPCRFCLPTARSALAVCPVCGLTTDEVHLAFRGPRLLRLEAELRAIANLGIGLGLLALIGGLVLCFVAGAPTLGIVLGLGGVLSFLGGVLLREYSPQGLYATCIAFCLLALLCPVALRFAGGHALFMGGLCAGAGLAALAIIGFRWRTVAVFTLEYRIAVQPELRHDQPFSFVTLGAGILVVLSIALAVLVG
jgi:hypothetical protein